MSKRYGILANPAKHSLSPVVQNAAFKALGIDAQFGIFEVPENEFSTFMDRVKHDPIYGLSVSSPYKRDVMEYLNEIDEDAKKIGAVNTVVYKGGYLYGYNVDYIGINKALAESCGDLKGKRVVIVGAGGAARAAVYGLLKDGAQVSIYNRTTETARELANIFSAMFGVNIVSGGLSDMLNVEADILVQTTSIWIDDPDAKLEELLPPDYLKKFEVVMDIVYKPLITPLIEAAKSLGIKTVTGDKMFLYQAVEQFKLWTEKEAPVDAMRAALDEVLV
ncbi:MAG: shikimate dehydrogenase [bacterium]|nr:shikimate dehydrogenase [bacterium]